MLFRGCQWGTEYSKVSITSFPEFYAVIFYFPTGCLFSLEITRTLKKIITGKNIPQYKSQSGKQKKSNVFFFF